MTDAILCLNCGSSSVKFSLYTLNADASLGALRFHGTVEQRDSKMRLIARNSDTVLADTEAPLPESNLHHRLLECALDWIEAHDDDLELCAAGHRIVHGGEAYHEAARVDTEMLGRLDRLVPLAPLHQPFNLEGIRALTAMRPAIPQVACFDTAFHVSQPAVARNFALPRAITDNGVRRYGFHGLSYAYIASVLPDHLGPLASGRVVVAHLGNGASMCALMERRSIASTMGFSALDGLMMGTRCGALDPGALLYLLSAHRMSVDQATDMLYRRAGLLGVSGISADMRTLLESDAPHAHEAVDLFCYRIRRELGSLAAALGGLDALVFTAGIGEHAAEIRRRVCEDAAWLGIALDSAGNAAHAARISTADSRVAVCVIPTDEELIVARETVRIALRAEARA